MFEIKKKRSCEGFRPKDGFTDFREGFRPKDGIPEPAGGVREGFRLCETASRTSIKP